MDIQQIRSRFPGTRHVNHLIASGAGLMSAEVTEAITDHLRLEQQIGGYEAHAAHADALNAVYSDVARLLNAEADEIALVENATVAWCQAFHSLPMKRGDRVITCEAEYAANYVSLLQRQRRDGIEIDVVPSTATGEIDLQALASLIGERTTLIAITWIPTNGGLVNPAAAVGRIARAHGITYLLDACQAVGQMPVDVQELQCDFLSATGRKFLCGPRGTGFLYVRKRRLPELEPIMIDHFAAPWTRRDQYTLRDDARRFETWENAYALRAGLGVAVRQALELGLDEIRRRAWALAGHTRRELATLPGCSLQDIGTQQCAIVSFSIDGVDPMEAVARLREQHINIGASSPDSTRLDAEARSLPVVLRMAPHYYNTEQEVEQAVAALKGLIPTSA